MNKPLKSWLILNSAIVVILLIGWWVDNQTPYERIRLNADHIERIQELKDRLASGTTVDELTLVASQAILFSTRLDGQIGYLSVIIEGQRKFLNQYWWVFVWFLISNAFLISGMQERRSSGIEVEPVAEREFPCRSLPMHLMSSFIYLLLAWSEGLSMKTGDLVAFVGGLAVVLILMHILSRYFFVSVSPVGFRSFQLGGSFCWVRWEDIESVRPVWLPFGLRYLRVFFRGSSRPVWIPLFLQDFNGFFLYVSQFVSDESPLQKYLAGMAK